MTYKDYEITAEAITESAEYSLDENGELFDHLDTIYREPEITCYLICKGGDVVECTDTLEEAKQYINEQE